MATRKLKNGGRRKAPFGSQEAAMLAAAGINVAGTLVAAGINSKATNDAAKQQADAINRQATKQAQALKDQMNKSKEYQTQSQEFIKEQNAENRELQKDIQMQLQMLTGQQNVNDRLEASKIQVRNGGSLRRKLAKSGNQISFLRGSNNIPFVVTDGGGVVALGQTPEGYDLYEIYGNDHEHYHKAQGGKAKTGVGIKFGDGNVIEGEGNQNTSRGEKLLVTPNNALFISKHTINGFNPAEAVDNGMHPVEAYNVQERIKAAKGISDDGKHNSPVKKVMGGNFIENLYNQNGPQLGVDTIGDTAVGAAYVMNQDKPKLRCGGRVRRKADLGDIWYKDEKGNIGIYSRKPLTLSSTGSTTPKTRSDFGTFLTSNADLVGSGASALGNIGAAWITSAANRKASKYLSGAYTNAANLMADAYRSLSTIDLNSLRREDFAAAHALPALQAPVSFAQRQLTAVDRGLQRRLSNAGRYSASSAAAQDRMSRAEIDAQDMRNQINSSDQQQMQAIRQANVERVTQAAIKNAELDTAANQQYTQAYLDMLEYNNDIENQKILGSAGALSEGEINVAKTLANTKTANANAWSNAITGSTQGFVNSLTNMATRKADLQKVLLGASGDSQASYYANSRLSSRSEAEAEYNRLKSQYDTLIANNDDRDKDYIAILRRRINNIATGRGFKTV